MATADAAPLRVVVADDSPESRALLRAMLDPVDGVEVVGAAADGRQAVELVGQQHPDLILLDIAMPVMDGLEAAAAIRANSPEVKIAMYSAYNRAKMGPAAIAAGADEYVEKAATTAELLDQIHRLFPDRAAPELRPPGRRIAASRRAGNRTDRRGTAVPAAAGRPGGGGAHHGRGRAGDRLELRRHPNPAGAGEPNGRPAAARTRARRRGTRRRHRRGRDLSERPASNVDYTLTRPTAPPGAC